MIKIVSCKNTDDATDLPVEIVTQYLNKSLKAVFAFPTGTTPMDFYNKIKDDTIIDWSKVKIFMLDVLYPQEPDNELSYLSYIKTNLLDHINLPPENFHILKSNAKNTDEECRNYEEEITRAGGLDVAILGIGLNGHIAFNEPGTSFDSQTHLAKLTHETRKSNGDIDKIPEYGLTMGLKTIISAQKIILLAKGENKAKAVYEAIRGPISESCPASILQTHPDCTFFLDPSAASLL